MRFIRSALLHAAIFALGSVALSACYGADLDYEDENPAFRCSPAEGGDCPDGFSCCSDDPAAQFGLLPAYRGPVTDPAVFGTPIFSENNNALSTQGMCVDTSGIMNPLTNFCPVPCNPTWSVEQVQSICNGALCCQTQLVDPDRDCILDPNTGLWRAFTGADIPTLTMWGPGLGTNQDPIAAGCGVFAGAPTGDLFNDCVAQLSVADQRGFCNAVCPCVEDLCALKNPGAIPKCGLAPAG